MNLLDFLFGKAEASTITPRATTYPAFRGDYARRLHESGASPDKIWKNAQMFPWKTAVGDDVMLGEAFGNTTPNYGPLDTLQPFKNYSGKVSETVPGNVVSKKLPGARQHTATY